MQDECLHSIMIWLVRITWDLLADSAAEIRKMKKTMIVTRNEPATPFPMGSPACHCILFFASPSRSLYLSLSLSLVWLLRQLDFAGGFVFGFLEVSFVQKLCRVLRSRRFLIGGFRSDFDELDCPELPPEGKSGIILLSIFLICFVVNATMHAKKKATKIIRYVFWILLT